MTSVLLCMAKGYKSEPSKEEIHRVELGTKKVSNMKTPCPQGCVTLPALIICANEMVHGRPPGSLC